MEWVAFGQASWLSFGIRGRHLFSFMLLDFFFLSNAQVNTLASSSLLHILHICMYMGVLGLSKPDGMLAARLLVFKFLGLRSG